MTLDQIYAEFYELERQFTQLSEQDESKLSLDQRANLMDLRMRVAELPVLLRECIGEAEGQNVLHCFELSARWEMPLEAVWNVVVGHLCPYEFIGEGFIKVDVNQVYPRSGASLLRPLIKWWFSLAEVEVYEKLNREIRGQLPEEESRWVNSDELMKKERINSKTLLKFVRDEGLPAYRMGKHTDLSRVPPENIEVGDLMNALYLEPEIADFRSRHQGKKSKAQQRKDRDVDRISKWMERIKEQCPRIFDYKLAEVIHWALSTPRPYFLDAKKHDWINPRTADLFDCKHSVDWIRKRIREIKREKVREKDQSAHQTITPP